VTAAVTAAGNGPLTGASTRSISPAPTDEEAAAIVASVQALWPRPVSMVAEPVTREPTWRFSGRWWAKPVNARRDRPFM
jgi:hypothetical protein